MGDFPLRVSQRGAPLHNPDKIFELYSKLPFLGTTLGTAWMARRWLLVTEAWNKPKELG